MRNFQMITISLFLHYRKVFSETKKIEEEEFEFVWKMFNSLFNENKITSRVFNYYT